MTSFQVAQWLRQGIAAAKAGDIDRAHELLLQVVDVDEYNEQAWLWLSSVVESEEDRQVCLENVLAINPDNKLAKAGLVHLRTRKEERRPSESAAVDSRSAPPAVQEAPEPAGGAEPESVGTDWWDQPLDSPLESVAVQSPVQERQSLEPPPEAEPAPVAPDDGGIEAEWQPEPQAGGRDLRMSLQRVGLAVLFVLGLLAAAAAVLVVRQTDLLDPEKREYATQMRPILEEYQAWWDGPQGTLIQTVNRLCGPGADGWRNWDVLLTCSQHPSQDCEVLAAHCGDGVEAMRSRVSRLAREAQNVGQTLLTSFEAVSPPEEIAEDHGRFLACLETQVTEAEWIGSLARGESTAEPDAPAVCQIFSSAEAEVQAYVGVP